MRVFRLKSWTMGVALAAAYMLVLQALLGAFALGSASASPMLDAFGNPLCITSSDSVETGNDRGTHTALPDCCTVACSMFAPVTTDDRIAHSLANPLVSGPDQPRPVADAVDHDDIFERGPGSPRAPPATV